MGLASQLKQLADKDGVMDHQADVAESIDVVQQRTNQLKAIFPDVFSDGKVNFERLKAALGDELAQTNECYELSWAGKGDARREIQKRTTATLRPDTSNSVNWDATQNLYIEGENLEVLRTLQKAYFGKVKLIYIDPPYNTGNDSFVYPDDYSETLKEYQARTGETDESGFLNKQNLWKKNSKESGQFHSVWLSMMYPRLFLARNLLREDGVILISIDENEVHNLRLMCEEIFGSENYAGEIIWKNSSKNDQAYVSIQHEYILCFVKDKNSNGGDWSEKKEGLAEIYKAFDGFKKKHGTDWSAIHQEALSWFRQYPESNPISNSKHYSWMDENGIYFPDNISGPNFGQYRYEVRHPITGGICKEPASGWRFPEETMKDKILKNLIHFGVDEKTIPNNKTYLKNTESQSVSSVKFKDGRVASNGLIGLLNGNFFTNPKDPDFLGKLFKAINFQKNDIAIDFFSGSATTAQAVLDLNEEDGGNRQFICAQMPELLEENGEAYRAGFRTIADIGRTRIKKVIERIEGKRLEDSRQASLPGAEVGLKQALGFNAFKLTPSNFKEWRTDISSEEGLLAQLEYHIDSTKPDSEAKCMVYELLLKMALPITTPVKCYEIKSGAKSNHIYIATPENAKSITIFFDDISEEIIEYILREAPAKVICLSKSFVDSQTLTNFDFQMQSANIALEIL